MTYEKWGQPIWFWLVGLMLIGLLFWSLMAAFFLFCWGYYGLGRISGLTIGSGSFIFILFIGLMVFVFFRISG